MTTRQRKGRPFADFLQEVRDLEIEAPVADIARKYGVTLRVLVGPGKSQHMVAARKAVAQYMRETFPGMGLTAIAHFLGYRSHHSILELLSTNKNS